MRVAITTGSGQVVIQEHPTPSPGTGEVLVAVEAATVNPVDVMSVAGLFRELGTIGKDQPVGIGWDAVGTVVDVGQEVRDVARGDRVAAVQARFDAPAGALADHLLVAAADVARVPTALDTRAAATLGMNALTAAQALELLGEPAGRSLLVTGAAGAVGGYAVELAAPAGWKVTGLARPFDEDFVLGGAELVTSLTDRTYDAVLDAAPLQQDPAAFSDLLLPTIEPGGTFVGVLSALPLPDLAGARVAAVSVRADGEALAGLLHAAAQGRLTPRVAGSFALEQVGEALAAVATPGTRGRWLVTSR